MNLPLVVSFSGGRTSGFMLYKLLSKTPIVLFANTGKERPETLDFVRDVSNFWQIKIIWLEYTRVNGEHAFKIVDYESANRSGKPFDELLSFVSALPNPRGRSCTAYLKIRTMNRYLDSIGIREFQSAIGIRADEAHRAIDIEANSPKRIKCYFPLIDDGINESDVLSFWNAQHFDLKLKSYEGNCDLCFLKSRKKIETLLLERPDLAQWWIDAERKFFGLGNGALFRIDRPSYASMAAQGRFSFDVTDADEIPCGCTGGLAFNDTDCEF